MEPQVTSLHDWWHASSVPDLPCRLFLLITFANTATVAAVAKGRDREVEGQIKVKGKVLKGQRRADAGTTKRVQEVESCPRVETSNQAVWNPKRKCAAVTDIEHDRSARVEVQRSVRQKEIKQAVDAEPASCANKSIEKVIEKAHRLFDVIGYIYIYIICKEKCNRTVVSINDEVSFTLLTDSLEDAEWSARIPSSIREVT